MHVFKLLHNHIVPLIVYPMSQNHLLVVTLHVSKLFFKFTYLFTLDNN